MKSTVIINTEYFLQCHGSCAGCFLTFEERAQSNTHGNMIARALNKLSQQLSNEYIDYLVLGFGRGNILNLPTASFDELLNMISAVKDTIKYNKITVEVSSSLIGKLDQQIEKALLLIEKDRDIYFNVVINSEITSPQFWKNIDIFFSALSQRRKSWGLLDNWGDILVLNVNPENLPDIHFLKEFTNEYGSPVNISVFPFEKKQVSPEEMQNVNDWVSSLWNELHDKDLNIKNFLQHFNSLDIEGSIQELKSYQTQSEKSYFFIDKNGITTQGMPSSMGEVDFLRLLDKYNIKADIIQAFRLMQKNTACSQCSVQKQCLATGAYLNFLSNHAKLSDKKVCASGYQQLFMSSLST